MKKLLLALSTALLFVLPSSAALQDSAPGPDSGPVAGRWDLPDPTGPGHFEGKLGLRHRDVALFRIVGRLERVPHSSEGFLRGRAILLVGPHEGEELEIVGRWDAVARGKGFWHARILLPTRQGHPARTLIEMRGRFHDPDVVGPGGRFAGEWKTAS